MIAGVIIEAKALGTFKRLLDADGWSYTEHPGGKIAGVKVMVLKVETPKPEALQPVLQRAMKESRN